MFQGELGADWVTERLHAASVSAVNAVEVGTKLFQSTKDLEWARSAVAGLRIPIIGFDAELADRAVALGGATRPFGLSLADRACLALALRERAVAVTTDRIWKKLEIGCEIELIR